MGKNKHKFWIPYMLLLVGLLAAFLITAWPKKEQLQADMSDYVKLHEKHRFLSSDMEQVLRMFHNRESGVVYIGFSDCAWCQDAVPILNQAAQEEQMDVYYVEARNADQILISDEQKQAFYKLAADYLDKDENGNPLLYTPYVFKMKNGKITAAHISTVEGHPAKERGLREKEQEELLRIYKKILLS